MTFLILFLVSTIQGQTKPTQNTVPGTYPPVPTKYWVTTRRVVVKQTQNQNNTVYSSNKSKSSSSESDILNESGVIKWVGSNTSNNTTQNKRLRYHTVKVGETLWNIAEKYFGDPWYWPALWSLNPHITNPHWLFPGTMVFFSKNVVVKKQTHSHNTNVDFQGLGINSGLISFRRKAFVEEKDFNKSSIISASPSEKEMLSVGDIVYIKYNKRKPFPGEVLTVYEPWKVLIKTLVSGSGKNKQIKKVNDGRVVKVLGAVRILELRPKKYAKAVIVSSRNIIRRKQLVGPISYNFTNINPDYTFPLRYQTGKILYNFTNRELLANGDMVIINMGLNKGLKKGSVIKILTKGDGLKENLQPLISQKPKTSLKSKGLIPYEQKGSLIVVYPKKYYSVAIIYKAFKVINLKDPIVFGDFPDLKPNENNR